MSNGKAYAEKGAEGQSVPRGFLDSQVSLSLLAKCKQHLRALAFNTLIKAFQECVGK